MIFVQSDCLSQLWVDEFGWILVLQIVHEYANIRQEIFDHLIATK
jgi:hypothetical protein